MSNVFKPSAKWKRGACGLLLVTGLMGGVVTAQDFTVGWNPRSGDVWVDTWLGDMNRYGSRYREPFIDEVVRYHGAPRPLVVDLLDRHWAPGDIYYACAIAAVIGRPCRYVVDAYEADRGQGWGVIAKRMGIKPGSPEFHRLKRGFVPTYDRWARPIDLDDELRRDYPDRGRGHGHGANDKPSQGKGSAAGNHAQGKSDHGAGHGNGKSSGGRDAHKIDHGGKGQGKRQSQGQDKGQSGKGQDSNKDKGNGKH